MSQLEDEADGQPQFPGDDPRPTSQRELAGWYCYGWAAEVFTVCAMGMYTPRLSVSVLLQHLKLILTLTRLFPPDYPGANGTGSRCSSI